MVLSVVRSSPQRQRPLDWGRLATRVVSALFAGATLACSRGDGRASTTSRCEFRLASEAKLAVADTGDVYIEPSAVAISPYGDILVGGLPNFVFRAGRQATDSLFGIVVEKGGSTVPLLRPPAPGYLNNARAAAVPNGWLFAFGQSDVEPAQRRSYERLLLAEHPFARDGWTRIDTLVPPAGYRLGSVSNIAVQGGLQALAVIAESPEREDGVLIFHREGAAPWISDFVPVVAAYAEVEPDGHGALVLLVVGPETASDSDANSLLVVTGPDPWSRVASVPKRSGYSEAHAPRLAIRSDSLFVAFIDRSANGVSARISSGSFGGPLSTVTLDSTGVTVTPVIGAPGLWVTQSPADSGRTSTRLWSFESGRVRLLFQRLSQESAWLSAALTDGRITIIQPSLQTGGRSLSTGVLRLVPSCAP